MINVNDKLIREDLAIMKPNAFAVLMAITVHVDGKNKAFPGIKRLSELTSLKRDAIYSAIKKLEELKYLERSQENKKGIFGKVIYRVTTKYLKVWINVDEHKLEVEEEEPLPDLPDTVKPENGSTVNGKTATEVLGNKGSISQKEVNVEPTDSTLSPKRIEDLKKLDQRLKGRNKKHREDIIKIVDAFIEITGQVKTEYSTLGALKLILHWLNDGHKLPQFKAVFEYKYLEFKRISNEQYIAIDTFCRIDKFEDSLSKAREAWRKKNGTTENKAKIADEPALPCFQKIAPGSYIGGVKQASA